MLNKLDVWLSIIDITICLIDFVFMYLIFIRMPHNKPESKPKNNFKKFQRKHGRQRTRVWKALR